MHTSARLLSIKEAVRGREGEVLDALRIPWREGRPHISCPYPDHEDKNPSWRWDAKKGCAHCSCSQGVSIFDVLIRIEGGDFRAASSRISEILGLPERQLPGLAKGDAESLLKPPGDFRDDQLVSEYLGQRLGVPSSEVLLPTTKFVGITSLAYYVPKKGKRNRSERLGFFPAAVFETRGLDNRRHAMRIYLAPGGQEKANLRGHDPKKAATKAEGQSSTSGLAVHWGNPEKAPWVLLCEGVETGAALAHSFRKEIESFEGCVAAALSANGVEAFAPWPAAARITVCADRDEAPKSNGREPSRRGEKAAREFGRRKHRSVSVDIALPGVAGENVDYLDLFCRAGVKAVRDAVLAARPYEPGDEVGATRETEPDDPPELSELNERHAVVIEEGKTVIINFDWDPVLKRPRHTRSSVADFKTRYGNRLVECGRSGRGEPKFTPLGKWWLEHRDRRQYEGVIFAPREDVDGYLNLWTGFSVDPKPGDWSKLRCHVEEVICGGDRRLFQYLINWMALTVQKPGEQIEVAIVLRGGRGAGKGMFVRTFGELFGQHFIQVAHAKHLVGNFNAHLEDAIVVFADEAFWAGDKAGESSLKTIITEPYIEIERKYSNVRSAKNVVHLIMASNEDWAVPAGLDERRFCVLDVAADRVGDHHWFENIRAETDGDGKAAMLWDLMQMNIEGFDVRRVPRTSGLLEQKLQSMKPEEKWWYEKLSNGQLLHGDDSWEREVSKEELHDDYLTACGKIGVRRRATETELGKLIFRFVPNLRTVRRFKEVKVYDESGGQDTVTKRIRCFQLPPLGDCRLAFSKLLQQELDWPVQDDEDYAVDDGGCHDEDPELPEI